MSAPDYRYDAGTNTWRRVSVKAESARRRRNILIGALTVITVAVLAHATDHPPKASQPTMSEHTAEQKAQAYCAAKMMGLVPRAWTEVDDNGDASVYVRCVKPLDTPTTIK